MERADDDVPLGQRRLRVGIIYNLKREKDADAPPDTEAEYDNIETVAGIEGALLAGGFDTARLPADGDLPAELRKTKIDIAFNIAEGRGGRGREAQIPAILNYYGIPFTGSDETTLCIALDKTLTKRVLAGFGIPSPRTFTLTERQGLHFPLIVKPNAEGSSKGISDVSIVSCEAELDSLLLHETARYRQNFIAEEYIEGREFTVGVMGNGEAARVFRPMEIAYKKPTQDSYHVYSYNVKLAYREFVDYRLLSDEERALEEKLIEYAGRAYRALECRDFARMDFRVAEGGEVFFIEINPLPGLAPSYSDYPMLTELSGVSYTDTVLGVMRAAVARVFGGGHDC